MWTLGVLALVIPFASCLLPFNTPEESMFTTHDDSTGFTESWMLGCYKDKIIRAMTFKKDVKSVEECIDVCKTNYLSPAGLQYGKQCFCGGSYTKYGQAKNCNMKCKSGDICGGFFALSVYEVELPKRAAPVFIGCYKDKHIRAMIFLKYVKSVGECINICKLSALAPAGVQYSKQCFCGGDYKKYGRAKNCNMKCKSGESCGGSYALSVYKVELPPGMRPVLVGCYKDTLIRAMTFKEDVKSVQQCINICKKSGLSPAGVQFSKQCFCGGHYAKYGHSNQCNMKCKSGEICGGTFATSVYKIGEALPLPLPLVKPDCSCSASGDPHYRTFDGQMIHFMGICKYTLATNTTGAPHFFAVEVKNEHRGNTRVSYTRMVDVKLNGVTIRLLPRNKVLVNGEKRSFPINSDLGYAITYSRGWVTVSTEWGLRVQFDGKHRVSVKVPGTFSNKLTGICGNCNRKKDDYRTKEGEDVSKNRNRFSLIGNSFKVKDDSDKPQTKCDVSDVNMKCPPSQTKRCDVIMHATFTACRRKLGLIRVKEYIESCKIDTCMYQGNKENINNVFCESIEGFVRECEELGVAVNWRRVSKCALKCESNKVYQFNAFECQPSCTNRKPKCTVRAEGCVCKRGFILSGDECVHVSKCGCLHKGNYLNLNEVFTDSKCQSKITCQLNGKIKTEKMKPCGANSECGLENGVRGCVCKKGFILESGKCVSKGKNPVDPCEIKPCQNGGTCKKDDQNYACNCKKGFIGKDCEIFEPCGLTPCKNGGTCKRNGQKYTCTCKKGFMGKDCEKVNLCGVNPCQNGGTCKGNEQKYTCDCKKGFLGEHCEKVDPCGLNTCQNGGTCKRSGKKYTCDCKKGFIGKHCEKANPCHRNPCKNGGVCTNTESRYKCLCKKNFSGKNCEKRIPDCVCTASGDPHYKTFDGQWIHFMGICKYTMAASNETSKLPHFTVEVKNEHRGNTRVSYTRGVDLKIQGETIRLLPGSRISINGELLNLPIRNYIGISAVYSAGWVKVTTSFGVKVQFDGKHRVRVSVPSIYRNQLSGICGDCNGKKDDYKTKAGVDVSRMKNKYALIGKSYEVIDDSDKPEKNCKVVDFVENCKNKEVNACTLLTNKNGPFAPCLKKLGSEAEEYSKACQMDACAYKNVSKVFKMVVCQAYEAMAKKCEELNVLINWRTKAKCPKKCSQDKMFAFKTSACQPSCTNRNPVCAKKLTEGCVCKPGTILSGDKCIQPSSCGCEFEGIYLNAGSEMLLTDCSEKIICDAKGKLKKTPGCHANTMCVVQGGVRQCACKDGFEMLNGICREVLIPPPPIITPEFLGPVLHMFIRVSVAYKEGTPIDTMSTKSPKACAHRCLNTERCKSFNFDLLREKCELFSTDAEKEILVPSSCPYKDYYQLIRSKNIVIRGAMIFTCVHLDEYALVKNIAECRRVCIKHKCKAMEYSSSDEECNVTYTTRADFGLIGADEFVYYETLAELPRLPVN